MALIVKVLAGSHRGAEAALGASCLIGSGADCDIVLSGDGVAERQLRLNFDDNGVTMTVLTAPVYVDGEAVTAAGRAVLPLQVISLGFAHIAFGVENSDWQRLKLPLIRPTEEDDEQGGEGDLTTGEEGGTAQADQGSQADTPPGTPDDSPPPIDGDQQPIHPGGGSHHHGVLWLGVAVPVVLLAVIAYFAFPDLFSTAKTPPKPAVAAVVLKPLPEIRKLIAAYPGLKADKVGSVVRVGGFLPHSLDLKNLKEAVRRVGMLDKTRFNIRVGDEVATSLKNSLAAADLTLEVELNGTVLRLFGVVADKKSLRQVLANNRFRLLTIKDETVTVDELVTYIGKHLRQKRFSGHIDISSVGKKGANALRVAGLVSEKDYALWQDMEKALAKTYPLLKIDDEVKPIPGRGFAVKSVVVGPKSFVTLDDGQTITEGQPLKAGYILDKITDGHLLVGIGSRQYRYVYH